MIYSITFFFSYIYIYNKRNSNKKVFTLESDRYAHRKECNKAKIFDFLTLEVSYLMVHVGVTIIRHKYSPGIFPFDDCVLHM